MTVKEEYNKLREAIYGLEYIWVFDCWTPLFRADDIYMSRRQLFWRFGNERIKRHLPKAHWILNKDYWWFWETGWIGSEFWRVITGVIPSDDYDLLNDIII